MRNRWIRVALLQETLEQPHKDVKLDSTVVKTAAEKRIPIETGPQIQ